MRIVVLSGGRSSEHEVSVRSGAAVEAGLRDAGHEVVAVRVERDGRWVDEEGELSLRAAAGLLDADAAFPVIHGPYGEDGVIQGALEALDLPYVGSGVLAAAVTLDKLTCKRLLDHHGIPQVRFCEAGEPGWLERAGALGLPIWAKPSRLGSSVGISRVSEWADLDAAIENARRYDPRVILEAHHEGREIECSVIGNEEPVTSLPGEIVAHAEWYDFEAKYSVGGMELLVPAPIPKSAAARVRELAAMIYTLLGCTGLARCDFFVSHRGAVLVNELNTMPGFTETSVFAKLFEASGIDYAELCDRLVRLAIERYETERTRER
jgi:D-alanine-D-alanine ligase